MSENQGNHQNISKGKIEESNSKTEKQFSEANSSLKHPQNPKSSQFTEQMNQPQEESQIENDIFFIESVGIDVSVDSNALKQFDYNESVDINN